MSFAADLVHQYGYVAVASGIGLESVGVPVPGETVLIVAAAYAGSTHRLSTLAVVVIAAAAAIVGDNLGFWIGRRSGTQLLDRLSRRDGRWANRLVGGIRQAEGVFDRHSSAIVVMGRFVSVLRTYIAFLSGHSAMRWRRFGVLNAAACILWASVVGGTAAALGSDTSGLFELITGAVLVALVGGCLLRRQFRRQGGAPTSHQQPTPTEGAKV